MNAGKNLATMVAKFRRRALAACVAVPALWGCCSHPVRAFSAAPMLICPADPVQLHWDVDGKAELTATPAPPDWSGKTPSKGDRTVHPMADTRFTLTSLEGNPAKDGAPQQRFVKVKAGGSELRGVSAPCAEDRHCRQQMTLDAADGLTVATVSGARIVRSGKVLPERQLCVTPPASARQCFHGNEVAQVNAPASGNWALEVELLEGEEPTPPVMVEAHFNFACR
jgi:hypothetical protein